MFGLPSLLRCALAGLLVVFLALARPVAARAQDIFEFQIYAYNTQGQGNLSPQLLTTFAEKGRGEAGAGIPEQNTLRTAVELEYGLTRRTDFAYYFNFAVDQQGTQYAGSKFRLRGRFAEKGELPIDLGWYAEIETWRRRFDDDTLEAEFMLTMQKDVGKWGFIANLPDVEKVLRGASVRGMLELSWRAEIRYRYGHDLHFGLQTLGGIGSINDVTPLQEQGQYIVPVLHIRLAEDITSTVGLILGLTQSSDVVMIKANFTFNSHDDDWD